MGALNRATMQEVDELVGGDPGWWPGFCGQIAENGQSAIKTERDMRGWSWSALWEWIIKDEVRYRDYMRALEAYVQDKALETIDIADGSEDAKLRVDTRFRLAGKVDRPRWGEQEPKAALPVVTINIGIRRDSLEGRLDAPNVPNEKIIPAEEAAPHAVISQEENPEINSEINNEI